MAGKNTQSLIFSTAERISNHKIGRELMKNKGLYIMALPVIAFYIIFHYIPLGGAIIAFKDYSPGLGILNSPWVGFYHFREFFGGFYAQRVIRNTILLNINNLLWAFPAPIILALLFNAVRNRYFKRSVQTLIYLPHFISLVIVCGLILDFTSTNGLFNDILKVVGVESGNLMLKPELFRTIYIGSGIWQEAGWGSIIYLAAISGISHEQYEAATIDGAGRWKQMLHVTIPGIMPTIVILLLLRMGQMMTIGAEKIILLYNPGIYETADVISSYVYRKGLQDFSWSFSTAVNMFNSIINLVLILTANWISRRVNETSLW